MRSESKSAREMADETAGRILYNLPVIFKSELRSELRRQLMPFCLKMADVASRISEIQGHIAMLVADEDVPDFFPSEWAKEIM